MVVLHMGFRYSNFVEQPRRNNPRLRSSVVGHYTVDFSVYFQCRTF